MIGGSCKYFDVDMQDIKNITISILCDHKTLPFLKTLNQRSLAPTIRL